MNKKSVLTAVVLLSVMQGTAYGAFNNTTTELGVKKNDEFIVSSDSMLLNNGFSYFSDRDNKLDAEAVGKTNKDKKSRDFSLKQKKIGLVSPTKGNLVYDANNNDLSLKNMDIDAATSMHGLYSADHTFDLKAYDSDFNFINDSNKYISDAIKVRDDDRSITSTNNIDINIKGNYLCGMNIVGSKFAIKGLNNINHIFYSKEIVKDALPLYSGIKSINSTTDIELNGSMTIGSNSKDIPLLYGLVFAGGTAKIDVNKDIYIYNAMKGMYFESTSGSTTGEISAGSINIIAKKSVDVRYDEEGYVSGVGLFFWSSPRYNSKKIDYGIIAKGEGGINIDAENYGMMVLENVDSTISAENGNINISGKNGSGIFVLAGNHELNNYMSEVNLKAKKDVNIYGGVAGLEYVLGDGSINVDSTEGNVNIASDKDGIKFAHYKDMSEIALGPYDINPTTNGKNGLPVHANISAAQDVFISGKENGIIHNSNASGVLNVKSLNNDVFIFGGGNGLYIDTRDIDGFYALYSNKGHHAKHDVNVNADKGSIYIGNFVGISNENSMGVFNTGRSELSIDAAKLVNIYGEHTGLKVEKETVTSIKGEDIVIQGKKVGLSSEGVNNLKLGYIDKGDKTANIIVSGDVGAEIIANTLGKEDKRPSDWNPVVDKETLIDAPTNSTIFDADNIVIAGENNGLKIVQSATATGADSSADIYHVWKNNEVNINANNQLDIVASKGTALTVDGINKVSINNNGNSRFIGQDSGISLTLNSELVKNNNINYQDPAVIDAYIDKFVKDKIKAASGLDQETFDKTYGSVMKEELDRVIKDAFEEIYGFENLDQLMDAVLEKDGESIRQELNISQEVYEKMLADPNKDSLRLYLIYLEGGNPEDVDHMLNSSYEDIFIESALGGKTTQEYYQFLIKEGIVDDINREIDVKDCFVLNSKGNNLIVGEKRAFNVDGKLTADVSGNINIFQAIGDNGFGALENNNSSNGAIRVANGGKLTVVGNGNNIEAGKITDGFGNGKAIIAINDGNMHLTAGGLGNAISGAIYVKDAEVSVKSDHSYNTILSSSYENSNGKNIVSAIHGTEKAKVDISAGNNGLNYIQSEVVSNGALVPDREVTVWANRAGSVKINGATNIRASNGASYADGKKGNALGIALFAGGRNLAYEQDGSLKPVSDLSSINLDYTSTGIKRSSIFGDIAAGYGGTVNIVAQRHENDMYSNNTLDVIGNVLAANGGENNVDFGIGGYWQGRADDYHDAERKQQSDYFNPTFSNKVVEEGKVNVKMDYGYWDVTGQSWLTSFNGSNNIIDMSDLDEGSNRAITIQKMNGENNSFVMDLDNNDRNNSDMLYIKDGNATIDVKVIGKINGLENITKDNGLRFATVGEGIKLGSIETSDGDIIVKGVEGGFYNTDLYVERQDYDKDSIYNESFNGGEDLADKKPGSDSVEEFFGQNLDEAQNLVIVNSKVSGISKNGHAVLTLSKVNYGNAIYMDRLNKRMGEVGYLDGDEGIWVRIRHDRIGKDNAFRSQNTMYEIGYDVKQQKDSGEHRIGMALDYMDGKTTFSEVNGTGEVTRKGLWLYDTWMGNSGHYRDFVAKWGHLANDYQFESVAGEATGEFSNNVFSVSAEFGKKNDIGSSWYFEPQVQMQFAHATGSSYKTTLLGTDLTDVNNDAFNSCIARAGFRLGRDLNDVSTVYFKGDILHEFLGEQEIYAKDGTTAGKWSKVEYNNSGTWYDLGFGFATKINKSSYAYFDFEKSFGNNNEDTYQINAGMQWSF